MLDKFLNSQFTWLGIVTFFFVALTLSLRKYYWSNFIVLTLIFLGLFWIFLPMAIFITSVALTTWFDAPPLFPSVEDTIEKARQKQQVGSDWILGGLLFVPWAATLYVSFLARKTAKAFFRGGKILRPWSAKLEVLEE